VRDIPALARDVKQKTVGIFGFEGVAALDLTGPLETLTAARITGGDGGATPCYNVKIIGLTGKTFLSESRLAFKTELLLEKVSHLDTLIIPGGGAARAGRTFHKIADWLSTNAVQVRRIVSICTGIYPLAQSGLLDGRKVTTHWRFAQDVARRFPKVRPDLSASFTKDGPYYTCGGGTAAIELTLALIEEDYGARVALSVARELGMRLRPIGNNESSLDPSQFECGPADRLAELPAWINAHLSDNLSVDVLAERACICPRHFSRLFKRLFHSTPADFVEMLRLNEARCRLVLPRNSVENVAVAVGFKNPDSFRRAFQRRLGMNPATFRKLSAKRGRRNGKVPPPNLHRRSGSFTSVR
jgi:transcriptional regulator GlxA family with amidase domain